MADDVDRFVRFMGDDTADMDRVRAKMADAFMERFADFLSDGRTVVGKYFHSLPSVLEELRGLREDVKNMSLLMGKVAIAVDLLRQRREG